MKTFSTAKWKIPSEQLLGRLALLKTSIEQWRITSHSGRIFLAEFLGTMTLTVNFLFTIFVNF